MGQQLPVGHGLGWGSREGVRVQGWGSTCVSAPAAHTRRAAYHHEHPRAAVPTHALPRPACVSPPPRPLPGAALTPSLLLDLLDDEGEVVTVTEDLVHNGEVAQGGQLDVQPLGGEVVRPVVHPLVPVNQQSPARPVEVPVELHAQLAQLAVAGTGAGGQPELLSLVVEAVGFGTCRHEWKAPVAGEAGDRRRRVDAAGSQKGGGLMGEAEVDGGHRRGNLGANPVLILAAAEHPPEGEAR